MNKIIFLSNNWDSQTSKLSQLDKRVKEPTSQIYVFKSFKWDNQDVCTT